VLALFLLSNIDRITMATDFWRI